MNITVSFRQMSGTESVKKHVHEKVSKLQKFLRQAISAQVTLSREGKEHIVEVHLSAGSTHLRGSERGEDMHACVDMVVDKLERQIRSVKGATVSRKKRGGMSAGEFASSASSPRSGR